MVNKIFYIKGDKESIFEVGLRPGILGKAKRFQVKTDPFNIEEEETVRVVVSGSSSSITAFHKYIKEHDVRVRPRGPMYHVGDLEIYKGPKIDWNYLGLSSISEQMDKGFNGATSELGKIDSNISTVNDELSSIKNKLGELDNKFGSIGSTLNQINTKITKP